MIGVKRTFFLFGGTGHSHSSRILKLSSFPKFEYIVSSSYGSSAEKFWEGLLFARYQKYHYRSLHCLLRAIFIGSPNAKVHSRPMVFMSGLS